MNASQGDDSDAAAALCGQAGQRRSAGRHRGEALAALTSKFGELKKHLYSDDGRLRSFVNIYVNDEDIRYLQKDKTPVSEGDTISIVPSIAGGVQI